MKEYDKLDVMVMCKTSDGRRKKKKAAEDVRDVSIIGFKRGDYKSYNGQILN